MLFHSVMTSCDMSLNRLKICFLTTSKTIPIVLEFLELSMLLIIPNFSWYYWCNRMNSKVFHNSLFHFQIQWHVLIHDSLHPLSFELPTIYDVSVERYVYDIVRISKIWTGWSVSDFHTLFAQFAEVAR